LGSFHVTPIALQEFNTLPKENRFQKEIEPLTLERARQVFGVDL
jgi:hypothetical protein